MKWAGPGPYQWAGPNPAHDPWAGLKPSPSQLVTMHKHSNQLRLQRRAPCTSCMAKEETLFQRQKGAGTECLPGEVALPVVLLAAEARWPAVFFSFFLCFFYFSSVSVFFLFSSLLSLLFSLPSPLYCVFSLSRPPFRSPFFFGSPLFL